jgi:hypothetical protein
MNNTPSRKGQEILCSVCDEIKPYVSYTNGVDGVQRRTNCQDCYELPMADWAAIQEGVKSKKNSPEYKARVAANNWISARGGTTKADVIKMLSSLKDKDLVFIDQEGYYAKGAIGSIYPTPEKRTHGEHTAYAIGYGGSGEYC